MPPSLPWKQFGLAFVIAMLVYLFAYPAIEGRRTRNGPWEVRFAQNDAGIPTITINQPKLNLTSVTLAFPGRQPPATNEVRTFAQPRPVPVDMPFGQCIFMDTTFLPGTLVFNLYGHEIQLIPRTLSIDRKEVPWTSGATIVITNDGVLSPAAKGAKVP